jgi:membrane protease subunit HflC
MNRFGFATIIVLAFLALIVHQAAFTVDPTEQALVLRFGQPVGDVVNASGLHFKVPFIDNVVYIDRRLLSLDDERQEVLVAENQRLEVDAFVRYRIVEPLLFYQSVGTIGGADAQLGGMLNSALRRTLSVASILDIVRFKRDQLMADIRDELHTGAARYGLDIIDVRIKRADLPEENSEAVFHRMQAERQQAAALFRAEGARQAQKIKADADRDATVTRATAKQEAEQLRGEGDGERNKIFAAAYGADPDFFAFYRSMQAYESALPNARAVIGPTSDFFRYFQSPTPAQTEAESAAPKAASEAPKAASEAPKPMAPTPAATPQAK